MKIYVNEESQVVALRHTNDTSLTEYEIDTENTESFFYNKCDTYLLGMVYGEVDQPQEDGTVLRAFTQTYYKDLTMLETVQQLYEENQRMQLQMNVEADARLTAIELGLY